MNARARKRAGAAAAAIAVLLPALAGCGGSSGEGTTQADQQSGTSTLPQSSEPSNLNPADFTTRIDNPYWPMPVGATWQVHVSNPQGESLQETITVTNQIKRIADGVTARVVHDVVYDHGKPSEITDDWYAQDREGNIWYFGENTASIQNGKKDTSGSFEAGRNGADAGIAMAAQSGGRVDVSRGVLQGPCRGPHQGARARPAGRGAGGPFHRRDPDRRHESDRA